MNPTPTPKPTYSAPQHGGGGGGGSATVKPVVTPAPIGTTEPTPTANPVPGPNVTPTPMATPNLSSLEGHWAKDEIGTLVEKKVVSGNEKGELNLQGTMTRAEFLAMVLRGMGTEIISYAGGFVDVSADAWYADIMQTAFDKGIIVGDGNGVNPEGNITREEMAKILVEIYGQLGAEEQPSTATATISDAAQISEWAKVYVEKAYALGLLSGMPDGRFAPKENMLREQGMVAIYRILDKTGRLS